jgi:hypothetical protein
LGFPAHIDLAIGAAQRLYNSCVGKSQHFSGALKYPAPSGADLASHAPRMSSPPPPAPSAGAQRSGSQLREAVRPVAQPQRVVGVGLSRSGNATSGGDEPGTVTAAATVGGPISHHPTVTPDAEVFVKRLIQGLSPRAVVLPGVQRLFISLASICAENPKAGTLNPLLAAELCKVCDEESLAGATQNINGVLHNCVYAPSSQ